MTPGREPTGQHRRTTDQGVRIVMPRATLIAVISLVLSTLAGGGASVAYHKLEPSDHDQLTRISQQMADLIKTVDELRADIRSSR